MKSLTRDEVRSFDRHAIEKLGIPGVVLMENAGRNAADAIETFVKDLQGQLSRCRVAILAGAGNNGGDGFVIARQLAMRGAVVKTFILAPAEKITGDAAVNLEIIRNLNFDIQQLTEADIPDLAVNLEDYDLVVDAIGGTGIRGELRGFWAMAVEQINIVGKPIVAIDIPTGLDCDTGEPLGPTIRAELTVTFVARKRGFDNPASVEFTGEVVVADIGLGYCTP